MRNLIAVAFVEPVTEGLEFPRDDWPLHITVLKFDVAGPATTPATAQDAAAATGPGDVLVDQICALTEAPVAAALGTTVTVGGEAGFGRAGTIPVSLIEPSEPLQKLHEALVRMVEGMHGRIPTPGYALEGYRPHVSHHGGRALREGDALVLDQIALVDMAPDGGHSTRRILRLWTDAPA